MAILTLGYNPQNTFAISAIQMLMESGAFDVIEESDNLTEAEEKEAFICTSRNNASRIFSKYL